MKLESEHFYNQPSNFIRVGVSRKWPHCSYVKVFHSHPDPANLHGLSELQKREMVEKLERCRKCLKDFKKRVKEDKLVKQTMSYYPRAPEGVKTLYFDENFGSTVSPFKRYKVYRPPYLNCYVICQTTSRNQLLDSFEKKKVVDFISDSITQHSIRSQQLKVRKWEGVKNPKNRSCCLSLMGFYPSARARKGGRGAQLRAQEILEGRAQESPGLLRSHNEVDFSYLPMCRFLAPGDPLVTIPDHLH